ncbi:MAG TPA: hypothetical protein PK505_07190, partial [Treponemataceae bacterium]|nr:hypothetical protein [Treponemataceae bacterium]
MKSNIAVLPKLFAKSPRLAFKMFRAFFRLELAKRSKKQSYGYDHMKNFCLIYMKLTPLCNLHCVMCGQRGDKGVLKGSVGAAEAKKYSALNNIKKWLTSLHL